MQDTGVNPTHYPRSRSYRNITIANGQTTSDSLYIGGLQVVAIWRPEQSGVTALTFDVSADNLNWYAAQDENAAPITLNLDSLQGATRLASLLDLAGGDYIRLNTGQPVSGDQRFTLVLLAI